MDLNKVLSLYNEGATLIRRCEDACHFGSGVLDINPYLGRVQVTAETLRSIVKNPDDIKTVPFDNAVLNHNWEHTAIINGVKFIAISEKEDLYGD